MMRDSPAFIKSAVEEAVVSWRWRQVQARLPSLMSDLALTAAGVPPAERSEAQRKFIQQPGQGAFVQSIVKLLRPRSDLTAEWIGQHVGALLSAMSDQKWPQARHYKGSHEVSGPNCLLC